MDDRLAAILRAVGLAEIERVAAGALGLATVIDPGKLRYDEILKPHADARTIGIVRVSGTAPLASGPREWSSVAKIIDTAIEGRFNSASIPENEEAVYERGLFAGTGLGFRPARCYHLSRPSETLKLLWLEDLTVAKGPPFEIDELTQMARHLGEWNAVNVVNPPQFGLTTGRDYPIQRWQYWKFPTRVDEIARLTGDAMVRTMYARQPIEIAREFVAVFDTLNSHSADLPHVLSFGDGPIGNYFYTPDETIAVDWSGLSIDPLGADGGCFIGSALTWGRKFADVAQHERALFDSYAGAIQRGVDIDRRTLRAAYLAHLGFYLGTIVILPTMIAGPLALLPRDFLEKRFDMPIGQFGDQAARVIDYLPAYIGEARALLAAEA